MAAIITPCDTMTFMVPAGQTVSGAVPVENPGRLGLVVPALTSGTLKIQVSADGATFVDLHDATGSALLSYAAGTGGFALSSLDLAALQGYPYLQAVTGATQASDRIFTLTRILERTDPLC